ncbi:hypothetical protein [Catenulispora rubra]|uniref:hypothetical protein n=1 Tax=Catenulispora rubra TaxID=280293 RepID=UPI0018920AFE|nr:hypothetical protein [Catenulispora rubra]
MIDAIAEYELRYRDRTEEGEDGEEELLELLDSYLPDLVYAFDSKVPPPRERRGALALEKEYYEWRKITSGDPETRRSAVIRSYLATETERRGQFRISRSQNGRLAEHFEAMGEEFIALGMPGHAALAYESAADLYLPLQQKPRRERALLNWRRARHLARPSGFQRFFEGLYDGLCGYGYRPFRMLGWMAVTLAVFSVVVWLSGGPGYVKSLHGCLIDFLNPLTFGDLDPNFRGTAQVFLIIESYVGTISMSIFFAFLVRD